LEYGKQAQGCDCYELRSRVEKDCQAADGNAIEKDEFLINQPVHKPTTSGQSVHTAQASQSLPALMACNTTKKVVAGDSGMQR